MSEALRRTWDVDDAPPDGTYAAEFDRYEDAPGGEGNGHVALLVVDPDGGEGLDAVVGSIVVPTDRVPGIDGEPVAGHPGLRLEIEDGRVVDLVSTGGTGDR